MKWGLDLGIRKTKMLVFNNIGRLRSNVFTFCNEVLANARNYTYLCVNFSLSDSFTRKI